MTVVSLFSLNGHQIYAQRSVMQQRQTYKMIDRAEFIAREQRQHFATRENSTPEVNWRFTA